MDIQELAGACHSDIGRKLAGQTVVNQRRDKQPAVSLFQQARMILFKPDQFIQRVKAERADAGERLQLPGRDKALNRFHHGSGSRAFPTDDRVEQLALRIDQRAIDAERSHRNTANNTLRQGAGE